MTWPPTTASLRALYTHARWRRGRAAFLRFNPYCVWEGCGHRATVVDHIIPRSRATTAAELQVLTWDRKNWQSLCKSHHDLKTFGEMAGVEVGRDKAEGGGPTAAPIQNISPSAVVTRDYSRGTALVTLGRPTLAARSGGGV